MDKKTNAYQESDLVDVYDASGVKLDPVPKRWVGTDLLPVGVTDKAPKGADEPAEVVVPDGDPHDGWTVPQIDKYAEAKGVTFDSDVKTKAAKLAVLVPAPQA